MKSLFSILLTSLLLFVGCAHKGISAGPSRPVTLESPPASPTHTISITIDSIPSGADVYAINEDGYLGEKLGRTPLVYKCGVAGQYYIYTDTRERAYKESTFSWGQALLWREGECVHWNYSQGYKRCVRSIKSLLFNIALAKGDHSIAVASKEIYNSRDSLRNEQIYLTVPLKTLAQVSQEMELRSQQQAAMNSRNTNTQEVIRDQNITIQQKKDALDSINSGLDALIKLHGLGAFKSK